VETFGTTLDHCSPDGRPYLPERRPLKLWGLALIACRGERHVAASADEALRLDPRPDLAEFASGAPSGLD